MSQDCNKIKKEDPLSDMNKFATIIVSVSIIILFITFSSGYFHKSIQNLKITSANIPSSYNSSRFINNMEMMASVEKLDTSISPDIKIVSNEIYNGIEVILKKINWFITKDY